MSSSATRSRRVLIHAALIFSAVSGVLYMSQNCGRPMASDVKSLDNFAAGKRLRTNDCSVRPGSPASVAFDFNRRVKFLGETAAAYDTPSRIKLRATVATVPLELQRFVEANNAFIVLSDDAGDLCTAGIGFDSSAKGPQSCVRYIPRTAKTPEVLTYVMPGEPSEIGHAMTRLMGATITQVVPLLKGHEQDIQAFQQRLASAFLEDVARSPAFQLEDMRLFLGETDGRRRDVLNADDDAARLALFDYGARGDEAAGEALRQRFLDYVFAESFDSYYCRTWSTDAAEEATLQAVAKGTAAKEALARVTNTRRTMEVLFPRSYAVFGSGIGRILTLVGKTDAQPPKRKVANQFGRGNSLGLADGDSVWWAGTKAFFGSVYDNTGGAAVRAYDDYSQSVERAANRAYDGNFATTVAKAVTGGVADQYDQKVYQPVAQKAEQRFNAQVAAGASTNGAVFQTINLAVGDVLGTTKLAEATVGADSVSGRDLSNYERFERGVQGTGQVAGNAALVAGFIPTSDLARATAGVGTNVATESASSAGTLTRQAVAEGFEAAQKTGSVTNAFAEKSLERTTRAFSEGAKVAEIPEGTTLWRAHAADGRPVSNWVSDLPPPDLTNPAAAARYFKDVNLPVDTPPSSLVLSELKTTKPIQSIQGTVSPELLDRATNSFYTVEGAGGGQQRFLLQDLNTLGDSVQVVNTGSAALTRARQFTQTAQGAAAGAFTNQAVITGAAGAAAGAAIPGPQAPAPAAPSPEPAPEEEGLELTH